LMIGSILLVIGVLPITESAYLSLILPLQG
jgi:hypothetical protein